MLPTLPPRVVLLMLCPLLLLLTGCASTPASLPAPPVPAVQLPPLPATARPADPPPPICSPTCLQAWRSAVDEWRLKLTFGATSSPSAPRAMTP